MSMKTDSQKIAKSHVNDLVYGCILAKIYIEGQGGLEVVASDSRGLNPTGVRLCP